MKLLVVLSLLFSANLFADQNFKKFLKNLKTEMIQNYGFSQALIEDAFKGVELNEDVLHADRNQPELKKSFGSYLKRVLSEKRIGKGKVFINELASLFDDIDAIYPVQRRFLLSFWAMETNFSSYTGYFDVIEAFATLIYDGRRGKFFKAELISILKVLQLGNFRYPAERIQGSWAGAIGSTQFLPSKILRYAIDFNNDGVINMWESRPDFLASSAKFLQGEGWTADEHWGYPIELPENFNYFESGLKTKRTVDYWRKKGITLQNGEALPDSENLTAVFLPQGHKGPKFLVYNNFFTIFRWNYSAKYALAIGMMSDRITDQATYWNEINFDEQSFLTKKIIKRIQNQLNQLGFGAGKADGIWGQNSTRAFQKYQVSRNLVPDGYLTEEVVGQLLR